jgi:hypothetical protein
MWEQEGREWDLMKLSGLFPQNNASPVKREEVKVKCIDDSTALVYYNYYAPLLTSATRQIYIHAF